MQSAVAIHWHDKKLRPHEAMLKIEIFLKHCFIDREASGMILDDVLRLLEVLRWKKLALRGHLAVTWLTVYRQLQVLLN